MILNLNYKTIDIIIDLVKDRKINYLLIKKVGDVYSAEYKENENKSSKMIELFNELEYLKENLDRIKNYYLYYNYSNNDNLIINKNISDKDVLSEKDKAIKNLKEIKEYIKNKDIDVTIPKGKRKYKVDSVSLINALIIEISK